MFVRPTKHSGKREIGTVFADQISASRCRPLHLHCLRLDEVKFGASWPSTGLCEDDAWSRLARATRKKQTPQASWHRLSLTRTTETVGRTVRYNNVSMLLFISCIGVLFLPLCLVSLSILVAATAVVRSPSSTHLKTATPFSRMPTEPGDSARFVVPPASMNTG